MIKVIVTSLMLGAFLVGLNTTLRRQGVDDGTIQQMSPSRQQQTWDDLMAGNKKFAAGEQISRDYLSHRQDLAHGQSPRVMILSCSDSRVSPELLFNQGLGDLFVVRSAGNIADAIGRGSLEYAVEHFHSQVLVVLGHTDCGAVKAACSGETMPTANLKAITDKIRPACNKKDGTNASRLSVEANVRQSAADLVSNSSILRKHVDDGSLLLVEAIYDLQTGEVARIQ